MSKIFMFVYLENTMKVIKDNSSHIHENCTYYNFLKNYIVVTTTSSEISWIYSQSKDRQRQERITDFLMEPKVDTVLPDHITYIYSLK